MPTLPTAPEDSRPSYDTPALPALRRFLAAVVSFGRWRLLGAGALMLVVGLSAGFGLLLLIPLLHGFGVGQGTDPGGFGALLNGVFQRLGFTPGPGVLLAAFVILVALHTWGSRARDLIAMRLRVEFVDHLRTRAYAAMAHAEWGLLVGTRNAAFTHVLTSDINRIGQGTQLVLKLGTLAAQAGVYLLISLVISPLVTLFTVAAGGTLMVVMRRWNRAALDLGQQLSESNRGMYSAIDGHLGGMKLAKAFGAEDRHVAHFADQVRTLRSRQVAFMRSNLTVHATFRIAGAASLALLVYLGLEYALLAPVTLVVLIATYARLFPLMGAAQQHYQQLLHSLPAFVAVEAMERECRARAERDEGGALPPLQRSIRLDRVCFRHPDAEHPLFRELSVEIEAGSTTALTGPSGAGKSTFADLLLGLLRPERGALLIDGVELTADRLRAWRRQVAYVPQEVYLLHDTLRANLLWAEPTADEAAMWRALRLAAADAFVERLPAGLDTVVGERGARLSGGERQRIALARALLRQPSLLVLDEATSALDAAHERQIQQAVDALHGRLTIVVIAHRYATLRNADRMLRLDNGVLCEVAAWEELDAAAAVPIDASEPASNVAPNPMPPPTGVSR